MKKLTLIMVIGILIGVSTCAFALNLAEQRYGTSTRQSVAMTIRYKVSTKQCTMSIYTSHMSVSDSSGGSVGFGGGNIIVWDNSLNDTDQAKTIGGLVDTINRFPNFEAKIVDAMEGDSVMLLALHSGTAINTEAVKIYFKDPTDASTTNTPSFQQIRIHVLSGEEASLLYVYANGDTCNLVVYKGNTEIWRVPATSNTYNSFDLTATEGGITGLPSADGLKDITVKADNVNIADTWSSTAYLQIWYGKKSSR